MRFFFCAFPTPGCVAGLLTQTLYYNNLFAWFCTVGHDILIYWSGIIHT